MTTRGGLRALAIAYVVVFATLTAFGLAIVLFGNPHAGEPVVRLRIAAMAVVKHATAPTSEAAIGSVPPTQRATVSGAAPLEVDCAPTIAPVPA